MLFKKKRTSSTGSTSSVGQDGAGSVASGRTSSSATNKGTAGKDDEDDGFSSDTGNKGKKGSSRGKGDDDCADAGPTASTPFAKESLSPILLQGSVVKDRHHQDHDCVQELQVPSCLLSPPPSQEAAAGRTAADEVGSSSGGSDEQGNELESIGSLSSLGDASPPHHQMENLLVEERQGGHDDNNNSANDSSVISLSVPDGPLGISVLPVNGDVEGFKVSQPVCGGVVVVEIKGEQRGGSQQRRNKAREGTESAGAYRARDTFRLGDVIVSINGRSIVGVHFDEAAAVLEGGKGRILKVARRIGESAADVKQRQFFLDRHHWEAKSWQHSAHAETRLEQNLAFLEAKLSNAINRQNEGVAWIMDKVDQTTQYADTIFQVKLDVELLKEQVKKLKSEGRRRGESREGNTAEHAKEATAAGGSSSSSVPAETSEASEETIKEKSTSVTGSNNSDGNNEREHSSASNLNSRAFLDAYLAGRYNHAYYREKYGRGSSTTANVRSTKFARRFDSSLASPRGATWSSNRTGWHKVGKSILDKYREEQRSKR